MDPNTSTDYLAQTWVPRRSGPGVASGIPAKEQRIAAPRSSAADNCRVERMVRGRGADRWGRKEADCSSPAHSRRPRNREKPRANRSELASSTRRNSRAQSLTNNPTRQPPRWPRADVTGLRRMGYLREAEFSRGVALGNTDLLTASVGSQRDHSGIGLLLVRRPDKLLCSGRQQPFGCTGNGYPSGGNSGSP